VVTDGWVEVSGGDGELYGFSVDFIKTNHSHQPITLTNCTNLIAPTNQSDSARSVLI
jgi:hypothetical protein